MAKQLSKYSQEQSTVSPAVRADDSNNPYSFKQWLQRNRGIIPGKENEQYQTYIRKWYEDRDIEPPTSETVKENYIQLLKQLTLAFQSEADEVWATDINFDDVNEVQQVIPFYAAKLKEIAIYLINKREAVKRAKLKYNQTGTPGALERIFYEYLLKAFTKRRFPGNEYLTNVTDVSVLNTLPELSGINNGFQIFIEEFYDDASYFDRDPNQPVSAYFTFNADTTAYLDNLNITYEDLNWLYTTGVSNLCADNPLLWSIDNVLNQYKNGVPLSAVELYGSDVLNEYNKIKLTEKYLGNDQYILSGGYWIPWESTLTLKFNAGNNWFYWLSGENDFDATTNSTVDPIPLTASSLIDSGATADDSVLCADIIFATRNDRTSAAWLKQTDTISLTPTMSTLLDRGRTTFMFPYPGYGLSGEDLPWTGRSYDNLDRTFFYLKDEEKESVLKEYWKESDIENDSFDPLYVYDSKLVEAGATPADKFSEADYIIKRDNIKDAASDGVFNGIQEYAWLYKILKTDIPIAHGANNIHWPLERYGKTTKTTVLSNQCEPLVLNNIDLSIFTGAVAGNTSEFADRIYKKDSPNSITYSEGAWLHGDPLPTPAAVTDSEYLSGVYQPGLAMRVLAGSQASFIWDQTNTAANDVFYNSQHQNDCWYLKEDQFSLFKEKPSQNKNIKYNAWQECSCRAVLYSPLGHPGSRFDEYDGSADFIAAITQPTSAFSFKDWKGADGKDYTESSSFGWFKLDGSYKVEPDVGWGSGKWVTNTGEEFTLSSNILYTYFRSGIARDNPSSSAPYLITNYRKTNANVHNRWYKLRYNKNKREWTETKEPADMILNPGDMLSYEHRDSYSFVLSTFHYEFTEREVPVIPDWKNVNAKIDLKTPNIPTEQVSVNVPSLEGFPNPLDTSEVVDLDEATITFAPQTFDIPGQTSLSSFEVEGSFTVDPVPTSTTTTSAITTMVIDLYTYTMDSINFVINAELYGWNYNANIYDGNSLGSRPIWVEASDKDDDYTKNKQINIWSGSPVLVDEYNFLTQPPFSVMSFEKGNYIEYNKRNLDRISWIQPLTGKRRTDNKKWCTIEIDQEGISNLSTYLRNNINELIVSATEVPSNIIFENIRDQKLQINYFARSPFTWSQSISDSSRGVPPTGGVWIPFETEKLITPNAPYTNLSNRHFPTYATAPSITDLYLDKESGGYFIPQILGASIAVAKDIDVILDPTKINNDPTKRGITSLYRDIDIFTEDRGLSETDQFSPVSLIEDDSSWAKHDVIESRKKGLIKTARSHQDFMPYQTYYESQGYNNNGIYIQGKDSFDPWFGEMDDVWENPIDWPPNFRGQYNIEGFYSQLNYGDYQLYQWKTDIFGNQYGLFKPVEFLDYSIYDRKHLTEGRMLTRSLRNVVYPASASLAQLFDYENVFDTKILDFDIWYDTMMVYKPSGLHLYRLQFDYEDEIIKGISDEYNEITLQNSRFGGAWFFEDDKKVTICTLVSCAIPVPEDDPIVHIYPVLRSLNIDTSEVTFLYNMTSSETDMSSYVFSEIDHPVFTYDKYKKIYNITYTAKSSGPLSGMYVTSINIKDYGTYYDIYSAKTITPQA